MRRTSKYSQKQKGEWTMALVGLLAESEDALTISEMQEQSILLSTVTSQMISRLLAHLIEMGVIVKGRAKNGRMLYKSVAVMVAQGYDVDAYRELVMSKL